MANARTDAVAAVQFYSRANAGDDLLVYLLAKRFPTILFQVPARSPNASLSALRNVRLVRPRFIERVRDRHGHRLPILRSRRNNPALRKLASTSDFLVHIGGSIFIEHEGSEDHWRRELQFYRDLPIPYFIIDANFGPSRTVGFPDLVASIFSGARDVSLRDQDSYEKFKHLPPVHVAPDVAFVLANAPRKNQSEPRSLVISTMRLSQDGRSAAYLEALAEVAADHLASGNPVVLTSFCEYQGDAEAADTLQARIRQLTPGCEELVTTHHYRDDVEALMDVFSRAQLVVGTRFHAIVIALALGVPVVPLAYSEKTVNMMKDVGLGDRVIRIQEEGFAQRLSRAEGIILGDAERQRLAEQADRQFDGVSAFLAGIKS